MKNKLLKRYNDLNELEGAIREGVGKELSALVFDIKHEELTTTVGNDGSFKRAQDKLKNVAKEAIMSAYKLGKQSDESQAIDEDLLCSTIMETANVMSEITRAKTRKQVEQNVYNEGFSDARTKAVEIIFDRTQNQQK